MRIRLPALTRRSLLRLVRGLMVTGLAVAVLVQLVPYGRAHSLPPVSAEPQWDSPATRDLAVRACFDCHSNEVTRPLSTSRRSRGSSSATSTRAATS